MGDDLERIWLVGALLAIGDSLALKQNDYFDHAPELILISSAERCGSRESLSNHYRWETPS